METVLIVEDLEQNRYLLHAILEAAGYTVLEASNGAEALALVHTARPDIVISDILMPVMDGYALCRKWHQDPDLSSIPFIFYTATYTTPQDKEFGLSLGATRFIKKPIEPAALIAVIHDVMHEFRTGNLAASALPLAEETTYYRLYNEVLIRKLEAKLIQLEQTNQALRASEARFRHVSKAIVDIAFSCLARGDANFRIEWITGAVESITGYTAAEILAQGGWRFLVFAEDQPIFQEHVVDLAIGGAATCELRLHRKDGGMVWVACSTRCVADEAEADLHHLYGALSDITERRQVEAALRSSEAALRRSQQIAKVGHWTWDTRANRVTWSDEMFRIFGVDRASFDGDLAKVIERAIHPDDVQRINQANETVIQEGAPAETEYRVVWPDGSVHQMWAMPGDSIKDEAGNIIELSGVVQDISDRKHAEGRLRLQAAALEAAANGIVITDIDGAIEWVNPAFVALTGYSQAEAIGHNPRNLVRSGHHDNDYYRDMWETILAGNVWRGELINRRKDGSFYTEEQTITPVRDDQGVIRHFIGIKQDITARKQAEAEQVRLLQQVLAQAEQMTQIMNSVPEGVILLDADCCVLTANPHASAQLQFLAGAGIGATVTHLAGKPLDELLTSPPAGQWHILEAGVRTFELIGRPVEIGPQPGGWVLVIRDITELRAVEQQLQRQERMGAIGQLAAGIAHDFNNIMSIIMLYAQMLAQTAGLDARAQARLTTIEQQAMRATEMIRQILDFSRRTVMERHTLDLLSLLEQQVELLNRTLPENIEIELASTPGEYFVKGDPTRLQQMFMNLTLNARDAMPEGGKLHIALTRVTVQTARDAPLHGMGAGEWVRFTVADTGLGMSAAVIDHVFEPFFTTKEPGKGTGLGLAQVHGIVGQHDGYITVTSRPGNGTIFTVYLPVQQNAQVSRAVDGATDVLPLGSGATILVVEDDAQLRATVVELLESWCYHVEQATNGAEALTFLAEHGAQVDLILSDAVMPKLGGVAMFKALRQRGLRQPVILISGHPLTRDIEEMHDLGLFAWISKPPDTEQLARTIAEALQAQAG